jgi:hypothetical protein
MIKREEKIMEYRKYPPKGKEKSIPKMQNCVQRNKIK